MAQVKIKLKGCESYSLGGKYKYKKGQVAVLDTEKDAKALAQVKASGQFSVAEEKPEAEAEAADEPADKPTKKGKGKGKGKK